MSFNGKLLRTVVMAACLVAAAGLATGAAADTKTEKIGRPGGTPFEAHCAAGQAVVGWAYTFGDVLMKIAPTCQDFADGVPSGTPAVSPKNLRGAEGGDGANGAVCKDRYAPVVGLTVYTAPDLRVLSLRTTCRPMPGSGQGGSVLLRYTDVDGIDALKAAGSSAPHVATNCPTGSYATGAFGAFVNGGPHPGIQSIGLVCHDDAGGDGDGNGKGKGKGGGNGHGHGGGISIDGFPLQLEINIGPG
jgi:hypothetical protein